MDTNKLIQELRRDEGVKYSVYKDTKGIPTVGVGHNLQASPLPSGWKYPLTDAQVDALLTKDLEVVFKALEKNWPWYKNLSDARQRVLANMCFNMGEGVLGTFKNTLKLIQTGKYSEAADAMLKSLWAKQVQGRAVRLAQMMKEG